MLLDPLEEQFHLPSAPVQGADGRCWQGKLVGQEHQVLAGLRIAIADASQLAWVVLGGIEAVKGDGLVADESCVAIHRRRIQASCIEGLRGLRKRGSTSRWTWLRQNCLASQAANCHRERRSSSRVVANHARSVHPFFPLSASR